MSRDYPKPKKPDDPKQSRLFIEKTREIGADEEKSLADELLGRLAKMAPEPRIISKQKTSKPSDE